jgi:anti-repressor protein
VFTPTTPASATTPTPTSGLTSSFAEIQALLPVEQTKKGAQIVNARALHEYLEVKTRFNDWFARRVQEYGFQENVDYAQVKLTASEPDYSFLSKLDYAIKLDVAKELAMVERNEKGRHARRYFIACEQKLLHPSTPALPATFAAALRQLAEQVEENERIQQQLQQRQLELATTAKQLEAAQPAVRFHNQLVEAQGLLSLNEVAKKLGFKVRNFFERLRADGVLMKQNKSNVAMSRYIDAGWFEVKTTSYTDSRGKTHVSSTTMVTGKGLIALQRKYSR